MTYEPQISAATLAGSLLSCLATAAVLVSFFLYRKEQRTFRHVLILNLTLSEFINSMNNTISGVITIRDHQIQPGIACTINGFIGQLSVQAADFSIFAIAIVTVLTVTRRAFLPAAPTSKKAFLALSVWIVPLFTSIFATVERAMVPVAGNWCWISASRPDLRYALTHGWRFLIIFGTIIIYAYIWWYMSRHFHSMVQADRTGFSDASGSSLSTSTTTTSSSGGSIAIGNTKTASSSFLSKALGKKRNTQGVSKAKALDDEVQAFPDSAANRDSTDMLDKELEIFDTPPQLPAIRLQKPPPMRMSGRDREYASVSPHIQRENRDLLSPPAVRPENPRAEPSMRIPPPLPPPPRGLSRPVVSWQLPAIPPSPKGSWRRNFKDFGVGQGSPAASPLAQRPLSLWPLPFSPMQSPRRDAKDFRPTPPQQGVTLMTNASEFPMRRQTRQIEREIKRMMLLNAYPFLYVLLSIPGLTNRLIEATTGVATSSATAQALQAPTQFIGLANALTYGFNRHVRHRIRGDWRTLRGRAP